MDTAIQALQRLREGNRRFVSGRHARDGSLDAQRRCELMGSQEPFAIILGCSDSRVPAELIFDQGLGDLFVIRVAGNIVAPSQIGSIEFAAERFGSPLVVVLGHSCCGAVQATLEELERPMDAQSPNLRSIVNRIRPAVENLLNTSLPIDPEVLLQQAVEANIRASVRHLQNGSGILRRLILNQKLMVIGAAYSLESGLVEFSDRDDTDDIARQNEQ